MRLFFPDLVKEMELEGEFKIDAADPVASLEDADYMRIEDNGADVTIFAFSSIDVLYAGHSRYHLMGVIKRLGRRFGGANFVFLRDCQRLGFHLHPDGSPGGLEFYEEVVKTAMKDLGAAHNVAIGSSFGGSVAHHMAYRCAMQQVITFSALFDTRSYLTFMCFLKTVFNLRQLVREPRGYIEIILVTCSTSWIYNVLKRKVGAENVVAPLAEYRALKTKPAITLFYGQYAPPDAKQAMLMQDFPDVKLAPVPTGRHNSPGFLYGERKLGKVIADEISDALAGGAEGPA